MDFSKMNQEELFHSAVAARLKRRLTDAEHSIVSDCYFLGHNVVRTAKEVIEDKINLDPSSALEER